MSEPEPRPIRTAENLYRRFAGATYGFFLRRTGDEALAADLNQELFLRVDRSFAGFEGRCSSRTWIFLLARSTLADFRASRWGKMADRTVTLDPETAARDWKVDIDADDEARAALLRTRLLRCLRRLSDVARAVVVGHYFEGATLRELTEDLRLQNRSGSRAVLLGAQRRLRRCLEQGGETT